MGVKWGTQGQQAETMTKGRATMKQAIFLDGAIYEAPTWVALEDVLRQDVWNPSELKKFRAEMALRASNWSGWHLNPNARAEMFLKGMEAAGMCRLNERQV